MSRFVFACVLLGLFAPYQSIATAQSIPAILTKDLPIYSEAVDLFEENIKVDVKRYDMKGDTLEGKIIVATLNKDKPPLVLAVGSLAAGVAEKELDESIPVVFCMVADPEAAGLVGVKHTTGVSLSVPLNIQLGTLRSVIPTAATVAVLYDSATTTHIVEEAFFVAAEFEMRVQPIPLAAEDDIGQVLQTMPEGIDVLWMLPDPVVLLHADEILEAAKAAELPVLAPTTKLVKMGALLALSPDYRETGRQAAELAKKLMLGVRPQDLPIEAPSSFGLAVNKEAAESLGIEIPKSLLGISIEYQ
jgi:putative ABC transport system substrate-binding protein